MTQNGKGDTPRPFTIDKDTFYDNWEKTFSKAEIETCAYSSLPAVHTYNEEEDDATSTQESS